MSCFFKISVHVQIERIWKHHQARYKMHFSIPSIWRPQKLQIGTRFMFERLLIKVHILIKQSKAKLNDVFNFLYLSLSFSKTWNVSSASGVNRWTRLLDFFLKVKSFFRREKRDRATECIISVITLCISYSIMIKYTHMTATVPPNTHYSLHTHPHLYRRWKL